MLPFLAKCGAVVVVIVAILLGAFLYTSIPTRLGVYRRLADSDPAMVGLTPAHVYGRKWGYTFEELESANVRGQTVLITGGNSGIGFAKAQILARLGADVTITTRSETKCQKALEAIQETTGKGKVDCMVLDTSVLSSVKEAAVQFRKSHDKLDILFLDAGVAIWDSSQKCIPLSTDGIEYVFATNFVGHHLLYRILEPLLEKSPLARVVSTSSTGSFDSYSWRVATSLDVLNSCSEPYMNNLNNLSYGQSKLAQIVWSKALTARLGDASKIYVNAYHPGAVDSNIWTHAYGAKSALPSFFLLLIDWFRVNALWKPAEGALTGLFLGVASDRLIKENIRGQYFHPQTQLMQNPLANDSKLQINVWDFVESLVEKFLPPDE